MKKTVDYHTLFFASIALVIILDQISKWIIRHTITSGTEITIIPGFFSIINVHNTGAGFSLFYVFNSLLIWASFVIIGILIYQYGSYISDNIQTLAFGLIIGGAVGNLI